MTTLNVDKPTVAQAIALKNYLVEMPLESQGIHWTYANIMHALKNAPVSMTANQALKNLGMRTWMDYSQHAAIAVHAMIFHTHNLVENEFNSAVNELERARGG